MDILRLNRSSVESRLFPCNSALETIDGRRGELWRELPLDWAGGSTSRSDRFRAPGHGICVVGSGSTPEMGETAMSRPSG